MPKRRRKKSRSTRTKEAKLAMRLLRRHESEQALSRRRLQDKERKQRKRLQEAQEAALRRLFTLTSFDPTVPGCSFTLEVLSDD